MHVSSIAGQHSLTLVLTCFARFCGQDEENDPSEEFEEWLACAVCDDHGMFIFHCASKKHEGMEKQLQYKVEKSGVPSAD